MPADISQCIVGRGRHFYGKPFLNVYVTDLNAVLRERNTWQNGPFKRELPWIVSKHSRLWSGGELVLYIVAEVNY